VTTSIPRPNDVARELNDRGREAAEAGRRDEAIRAYEAAVAADPSCATPLFNLGLLYKHECNWVLSLDFNQRAIVCEPTNEAAVWNLGIAATALGRWGLARRAWRDFGIEIPEGDGPVELPCGTAPIRINPRSDGEVVWGTRIDPARAVLENIPYPESGHGFHDLVLNDGAPNGYRVLNGKEVAVLDELQHLERSEFGTFVAKAILDDLQLQADRLVKIAASLRGAAEDWTSSVRILCKRCSEGRPHSEHDRDNRVPDRNRTIAVAATSSGHADRIVRAWQGEFSGIRIESFDLMLQPRKKHS